MTMFNSREEGIKVLERWREKVEREKEVSKQERDKIDIRERRRKVER